MRNYEIRRSYNEVSNGSVTETLLIPRDSILVQVDISAYFAGTTPDTAYVQASRSSAASNENVFGESSDILTEMRCRISFGTSGWLESVNNKVVLMYIRLIRGQKLYMHLLASTANIVTRGSVLWHITWDE